MKQPKKEEYNDSCLADSTELDKGIASAMDCTGLIPSAVLTEDQSESYGSLYNIHRPEPEKQLFGQKANVKEDSNVIPH
ncbi:MAG: hypothetical protein ACYCX2_01495 [Christensenellales bacterium]